MDNLLKKSCRALARAVILQALIDIQTDNGHAAEAAAWLHGREASLIMDAIGLDAGAVNQAIERVSAPGAPTVNLGRDLWTR